MPVISASPNHLLPRTRGRGWFAFVLMMSSRLRALDAVERAPRGGGSGGPNIDRPDPEDAVLVAMIRAGHKNAAATFFDRYGKRVERLLMRVLGPDSELEDVLQDVFIDALSAIDQLRDPNKLESWLTRMTVLKARSLIQRRQRWRIIQFRSPTDVPEIPDVPQNDARALLNEVQRVLLKLSADERVCFTLRYFEEMTLPEIAAATGLSLATVKRKLKRAEERVRRLEATR